MRRWSLPTRASAWLRCSPSAIAGAPRYGDRRPLPTGEQLEQLRRHRSFPDRDFEPVLAKHEIALVDAAHLVQHALAHAGLVDLLGDVGEHERLHAGFLAQLSELH